MRRLPILLAVLAAIVFIALNSVFIVDERKQALVLQFGQVKQVKSEPGMGFKIPFIQDAVYYEKRILPLETRALRSRPSMNGGWSLMRLPVGGSRTLSSFAKRSRMKSRPCPGSS